MSISITTCRNDYTGDGTDHVFPYTFKVFSGTDLLVTVNNPVGSETTLALNTDYSVSGVGEDAGGNVTLIDDSQSWLTSGELTTGFVITIKRVRSLTQSTDIRNQGEAFPEVMEDALDNATMVDQQQQDAIDRSIKIPVTLNPSDFSMELPVDLADRADQIVCVNSDGDGITTKTSPSTLLPVTVVGDDVIFDSSTDVILGGGDSRTVGTGEGILQIEGNDADSSVISVIRNSASAGQPKLYFAKSRGATLGSVTAVQAGDALGTISFYAADGTDLASLAARIDCVIDGTPGANDTPGLLMFSTTADGSDQPVERMRINSAGSVFIGATSSTNAFPLYVKGGNLYSLGLDNAGEQYTSLRFHNNGTFKAQMYWDQTNTRTAIASVAGDIWIAPAGISAIQCSSTGITGFNCSSHKATLAGAVDIGCSTYALTIGADSGASTRTDATIKTGMISSVHYTNAEKPVGVVLVVAGATTNEVDIGGGTSAFNAATSINFITGATNTTATGTTRMFINSLGAVSQPTQPSFLVVDGTGETDITGDNTVATKVWPTEVYDQGSNFASNTFTATVTGKYQFNVNVMVSGLTGDHTNVYLSIVTSNRTYFTERIQVSLISTGGLGVLKGSVLADMDVNDTAIIRIEVDGTSKVVDVYNNASYNFFSGSLIN